ncbi:hypothetical protein D9611_002908 [Ephemerocybe angulata]|uniref:Uncharacterized protein n=1 Tax=Ephemerocybe angulata TaxID=980116 RepID=A0A8H5CAM6_9AGAR|nr:hypothetical protein D9611_002908 [Tulosesus angulatus]
MNKNRKPRDSIAALRLPQNGNTQQQPPQYTNSTKKMVEIATTHHSSIQNIEHHPMPPDERERNKNIVINTIKTRVQDDRYEEMNGQFSREEIVEALRNVPNGKAAGLDGIPVEIWKFYTTKHKETAGVENETPDLVNILVELFNDIAEYGVAPETEFAEGWLCPIYKKKDRTDISNYRPITVLNTDYKILTRTIMNRLSKIAPELIHPDQAGFMKNRSIHTQTDLIHTVIGRCANENIRGTIVCLDQEKAYDKVKHEFLWDALGKMNLPAILINTIKSLYADAKTAVILNGMIGQKFRITRGVRQGDPLSCLLFNIAIESLAEMLRTSGIEGLTFPGTDKRVLSCLFADDTTVFLSANDKFSALTQILETWCKASGAKFNIEKTVVIPLGDPDTRKDILTSRKGDATPDRADRDAPEMTADEIAEGFEQTAQVFETNDDPLRDIRIFTNWDERENEPIVTKEVQATDTPAYHRRSRTVYTDGSCNGNGTDEARAGSGIWYGENHWKNTSIRLPGTQQTNNTGELVAALVAMQQNRDTKVLKIFSDSTYTIGAVCKHIPKWTRLGYIGVANKDIVGALAGEIAYLKNSVWLAKVKGHSGNTGNDGADRLAALGAQKETPDTIDLEKGKRILDAGARLDATTQAILYKGIKQRKTITIRKRTQENLETIINTVEALTGVKHTEEAIWRSLLQNDPISTKTSAFLWKAIHGAHKVGEYWKHTGVSDTHMPCELCNEPVESIEHILLECRATGQEEIWRLTRELWNKTGRDFPHITLGMILGIGVMEVRDTPEDGSPPRPNPTLTRLLRILVSEATYLIWLLRCEWRIGREADIMRLHTISEIRSRWRSAIAKRMRLDSLLTNRVTFGNKALRAKLVLKTWEPWVVSLIHVRLDVTECLTPGCNCAGWFKELGDDIAIYAETPRDICGCEHAYYQHRSDVGVKGGLPSAGCGGYTFMPSTSLSRPKASTLCEGCEQPFMRHANMNPQNANAPSATQPVYQQAVSTQFAQTSYQPPSSQPTSTQNSRQLPPSTQVPPYQAVTESQGAGSWEAIVARAQTTLTNANIPPPTPSSAPTGSVQGIQVFSAPQGVPFNPSPQLRTVVHSQRMGSAQTARPGARKKKGTYDLPVGAVLPGPHAGPSQPVPSIAPARRFNVLVHPFSAAHVVTKDEDGAEGPSAFFLNQTDLAAMYDIYTNYGLQFSFDMPTSGSEAYRFRSFIAAVNNHLFQNKIKVPIGHNHRTAFGLQSFGETLIDPAKEPFPISPSAFPFDILVKTKAPRGGRQNGHVGVYWFQQTPFPPGYFTPEWLVSIFNLRHPYDMDGLIIIIAPHTRHLQGLINDRLLPCFAWHVTRLLPFYEIPESADLDQAQEKGLTERDLCFSTCPLRIAPTASEDEVEQPRTRRRQRQRSRSPNYDINFCNEDFFHQSIWTSDDLDAEAAAESDSEYQSLFTPAANSLPPPLRHSSPPLLDLPPSSPPAAPTLQQEVVFTTIEEEAPLERHVHVENWAAEVCRRIRLDTSGVSIVCKSSGFTKAATELINLLRHIVSSPETPFTPSEEGSVEVDLIQNPPRLVSLLSAKFQCRINDGRTRSLGPGLMTELMGATIDTIFAYASPRWMPGVAGDNCFVPHLTPLNSTSTAVKLYKAEGAAIAMYLMKMRVPPERLHPILLFLLVTNSPDALRSLTSRDIQVFDPDTAQVMAEIEKMGPEETKESGDLVLRVKDLLDIPQNYLGRPRTPDEHEDLRVMMLAQLFTGHTSPWTHPAFLALIEGLHVGLTQNRPTDPTDIFDQRVLGNAAPLDFVHDLYAQGVRGVRNLLSCFEFSTSFEVGDNDRRLYSVLFVLHFTRWLCGKGHPRSLMLDGVIPYSLYSQQKGSRLTRPIMVIQSLSAYRSMRLPDKTTFRITFRAPNDLEVGHNQPTHHIHVCDKQMDVVINQGMKNLLRSSGRYDEEDYFSGFDYWLHKSLIQLKGEFNMV